MRTGQRKGKKPTLSDVAKRSGLSPATVSRVLHGYATVDPKNRELVEDALKELNYTRRPSWHTGGRKDVMTFGLVVPDLANPFFPTLIKGIENVAKMYDASLIVCDSENSVDLETRLLATLVQRGIDGLLFVPASDTNPYVSALLDRSFPVVFVDRIIRDSRINALTAANDHGAYQAIQYLISLGHRAILYIGGLQTLITEQQRLSGYRRAIEESGGTFDDRLVIHGSYSSAGAREALDEALGRGAAFTAVFAANDVMAFGAMQCLKQRGRAVPDDVSVMGFDGIPFSELVDLTTVSQHPYEMGTGAMTMLINLVQNRLEPPHFRTLMPSLIIRKSCRRYP